MLVILTAGVVYFCYFSMKNIKKMKTKREKNSRKTRLLIEKNFNPVFLDEQMCFSPGIG